MVATLKAPPASAVRPAPFKAPPQEKAAPATRQREKLAVIDCDIHAAMPNDATLFKYLPTR
ncbi:hypothetical protein M2T37_27420, partial [Klebsiella pneumoniae]|uniref:hypothetical protein n=1 Tax=Klebsiella pneumoniae TaxID=573 RepID=UPI00200C56AF